MDHIGIDVHKNQSQVCIFKDNGERVEQRILTDRIRLGEVFGGRPGARILLEASTESEWVARCLEELGHEVIVADPNFAPMYDQCPLPISERRTGRQRIYWLSASEYRHRQG